MLKIPIRARRRWSLVAVFVFCAPVVFAQSAGDTQQGEAEPLPLWEWPEDVEGTLRTFFEREDVEAMFEGVNAPADPGITTIEELVGIVGGSTEQAFRYVQRRIRYESYAGSIRGALGTLRSGGGNALDQALLLRELYRASGRSVRLARGRLSWEAAVELAGGGPRDRVERGDPWLRQVEAASDHWWVEVRDGGGWVAADPAFAGTAMGETPAGRRQVMDEVPDRFVATVDLELNAGGRRLTALRLPVAQIFGLPVQVRLARAPDEGAESDSDEIDRAELESGEGPEPVVDAEAADPPVRDPLDMAPVLEALPAGVGETVQLELLAGTHRVAALPVAAERLDTVRLAVDVEIPPGRHLRATLPFGPDPHGRLAVVVAGGAVRPSMYQPQLQNLYAAFETLVGVEQMALEAWRQRPDEDVSEDTEGGSPIEQSAGLFSAPQLPPLPGSADVEEIHPVHPAIALHVAALAAWDAFAEHATGALALTLLAATDELRAVVPIDRAELRMVALQHRPSGLTEGGGFTVWTSDPARVRGGAPRQMALGLLQSAMAGQVLNKIADQAPVTAFDLTLRAVGSGSRLAWFLPGQSPPDWPTSPAAVARADLQAGRTLIGPRQPLRIADTELVAWWSIASATGMTAGRVEGPLGVAQAGVGFGEPVDLASLDSILATLHDLHEAMRWLLRLGEDGQQTLRDLVPGVCAATPLVAELMRAGAPEDFVAPAFADFCQRAGVS
jgi:hypothetical protein